MRHDREIEEKKSYQNIVNVEFYFLHIQYY
jgi:hypothetical protein